MKSEPLPKCCRSGCVPPPPGLLGFLHRSLALKTNKKNKRKEEKNEHTCQSLSTVQHTSRNKRAHTPSYPEFIQHTQRKKKSSDCTLHRIYHSTQNLSSIHKGKKCSDCTPPRIYPTYTTDKTSSPLYPEFIINYTRIMLKIIIL